MDKYINESMKEACAEIEAQQSWEDEQFMDELDAQLGVDELEEMAWNGYQREESPERGPAAWVKRMFDLGDL